MKIPSVLFEDETLLVLDKPSGMTVNRSQTTRGEGTLQDWIETKLKIKNEKLKIDKESDFYKRAGIVHRLDKETSGVLIVAKTQEAFENLQRQFKERGVEKTYVALVHGVVQPEEGEIRVPVGRLPWNRKRFGVVAGGREAVTKYKVIKYYSCYPELARLAAKRGSGSRDSDIRQNDKGKVTFLELYPETGRTHQIRVHLKYFGHAVFSDELYAGRKTARNDRHLLPRLFLHAQKISFTHPCTGERLSLKSPLPSDLDQFLRSLGANRISPGR